MKIASLSGGRSSSYMAVHYPADVNLFALVQIEDPRCSPEDKKIIQMVSDKIGHQFIATAEDDLTLQVMFDLEQMIGKEIKWLTGPTFESIFKTKYEFGGRPSRLPSRIFRYCTTRLKIIPIFQYCFLNYFQSIDDQVIMDIGYRSDESHRRDKFTTTFNYPISCRLYGEKRQIKKVFNWRIGNFPLIDNQITQFDVHHYFKDKSIVFPPQSNCAGCFHKDPSIMGLK